MSTTESEGPMGREASKALETGRRRGEKHAVKSKARWKIDYATLAQGPIRVTKKGLDPKESGRLQKPVRFN